MAILECIPIHIRQLRQQPSDPAVIGQMHFENTPHVVASSHTIAAHRRLQSMSLRALCGNKKKNQRKRLECLQWDRHRCMQDDCTDRRNQYRRHVQRFNTDQKPGTNQSAGNFFHRLSPGVFSSSVLSFHFACNIGTCIRLDSSCGGFD